MKIEFYYTDEDGNVQQCKIIGSLQLIEFIHDIEFMQRLYENSKFTQAELEKDKLSEKLDDLMRLGSTNQFKNDKH